MTTPRTGTRVEVVDSIGTVDANHVADLLTATEEADGYPSISERARLDVGPRSSASASALLLRGDRADGPALAGYAVLEHVLEPGRGHGRGHWTLEMAVHPARRHPAGTSEGALLGAALETVAAAGGGRITVWVRGNGAGPPAWIAARGLEPARDLLQLRAPLPVEAGPRAQDRPLQLRPFHPGRDEEAWLEVNRRAFAHHPEQGAWTLADLERREQAPWFDPGGFLIHEVDHRIAGFCWTKVHRTPVVGEIYVIAVDPDFQGRGLGRALTVAGLDHLATRGVPEAMLYVEGANVAALTLYRSLGFAEHHRETAYEAEVAPRAGAGAG